VTTPVVLWSVSGLDVVLAVFRAAMPDARFGTRRPDELPGVMPFAVVRRTGGSSPAPRFYDRLFCNVQCWAGEDRAAGVDAARAAEVFADRCRRALWEAQQAQTVTEHGWICQLSESEGPEDTPDPGLPHHGRYVATYQLLVRRFPHN
jgi:hypothetical protein